MLISRVVFSVNIMSVVLPQVYIGTGLARIYF